MTEVSASAVDCVWPKCRDSDGECKLGYPCTGENDRVVRVIEDPPRRELLLTGT